MFRTVFLIGDDSASYAELMDLQDVAGFRACRFRNAEEFLNANPLSQSGCVLTEIHLPGMNGFELHAALVERRASLPVIFLTADGNVSTAVRAMRAGAFDFLQEPVDSAALLRRVHAALVNEERQHVADETRRALNLKFQRLTPRECDVMRLVVSGRSNKQTGQYLRISHRTVEVYRGRLMQKLEVTTLLDLAAFARECEAYKALANTTMGVPPIVSVGTSMAARHTPQIPSTRAAREPQPV